MRRTTFPFLLFLAVIFSGLTFVAPARAATIQVDTAFDNATTPDPVGDSDCSLREAIQNANDNAATYPDCAAGSGADIITFDSSYTINFDDEISIASDITIQGPVTFDGSNGTRFFVVSSSSGILRLETDIILQNGITTGSGGAILVNNSAQLFCADNVTFDANIAANNGGAIDSSGSVTIEACTFQNNLASNSGGAISQTGAGVFDINESFFLSNRAGEDIGEPTPNGGSGGAIYNFSEGTITETVFLDNSTDTKDTTGSIGGGAIWTSANSGLGLQIVSSGFSGNIANGDNAEGGAIFNNFGAILDVRYSHFGETPLPFAAPFDVLGTANETSGPDGDGGAIFTAGPTEIVGSSFIGNSSANNGGALYVIPTAANSVVIANSTFNQNVAAVSGGGLYFDALDDRIRVENTTIYANAAGTGPGGGIFLDGDGDQTNFEDVIVSNTILASNTSLSLTELDCGGDTLSDGGGNVLFGSVSCLNLVPFVGNPNLSGYEVTQSQGVILTISMPLGSGSAALGVGDPGVCAADPVSNVDQRIQSRPQGDPDCDSGAYESSQIGATPTPTNTETPTPTSTPTEGATDTPTSTPTATDTDSGGGGGDTATPTPTDSGGGATDTPTPTFTDQGGNTATPTPTNTDQGSPTDTPTPTFTDQGGNTATPTPTNTDQGGTTDTPTPTDTNQGGVTNTPTNTNTPGGPTDTPTNTPTATETNQGGVTNTPTATNTTPAGSSGTPVVVVTDPFITKSVNPPFAVPGEIVTWTIVVTNPGSIAAPNVSVTDTMPAVIQIQSVAATAGTINYVGQVVTWNIASLAPGQVVTITIVGQVRLDAQLPFVVNNTASLTTSSGTRTAQATLTGVTSLPATGEPMDPMLRLVIFITLGVVGAVAVQRIMRRTIREQNGHNG